MIRVKALPFEPEQRAYEKPVGHDAINAVRAWNREIGARMHVIGITDCHPSDLGFTVTLRQVADQSHGMYKRSVRQ